MRWIKVIYFNNLFGKLSFESAHLQVMMYHFENVNHDISLDFLFQILFILFCMPRTGNCNVCYVYTAVKTFFIRQ